MTLTVFLTTLLAALLHATWNAVVKGSGDKAMSMAAVIIGHVPFAFVALLFVPFPAVECLPYILGGTVFHFGYQVFLLHSYSLGDLTQVYPIARGTAPLIVAGVSVLFLGVVLSGIELLAIGCIVTGILSLCLVRRSDGTRNPKAARAALITGCFIAGYSLVDGLGARVAGTGVGFYSVLCLVNAAVFALFMAWRKPGLLSRIPREAPHVMVIGGGASFVAFAMVVWGFTQAPIALVTALRETSIVFALLIGVFIMGERLDLGKVLSTALSLGGAILLRFAK